MATKTVLTLVPQVDCIANKLSGFGRLLTDGGKAVIGATTEVIDGKGLVIASAKTDSTGTFIVVGGELGSSGKFQAFFGGTAALAPSQSRKFNVVEFCARFPVVVGKSVFAYKRNPDVPEQWGPILNLAESLAQNNAIRGPEFSIFIQAGRFDGWRPLTKSGEIIGLGAKKKPAWDLVACALIGPGSGLTVRVTNMTFGARFGSGESSFFDRRSPAIGGKPADVTLEDCIIEVDPGNKMTAYGQTQADRITMVNCEANGLMEFQNLLLKMVAVNFNGLNLSGAQLLAMINGGDFQGTINLGSGGTGGTSVFTSCPGRAGTVVNVDASHSYLRDASSNAAVQNGVNGSPGGGSF